MRNLALSRLAYAVKGMIAASILVLPLMGCTSEPEKSPEQIEENRQEHGKNAQRELQDG